MPNLEDDLNPDTWIGLSFPLGRSDSGFFPQTQTFREQANSNLKNLLLTIPGERVGINIDFGSHLHHLLFEPMTDDLSNKIEETISEAVNRWTPYIDLKEINVKMDNRDYHAVSVEIKYSIIGDDTQIDSIVLDLEDESFASGY
jgi:phage baseplate assembly protein W